MGPPSSSFTAMAAASSSSTPTSEQERSEHQVDHALDRLPPGPGSHLLDVEQRLVADRQGADPPRVDAAQARRDLDVDTGAQEGVERLRRRR